jgi:predicted aconitase with swiveling domain
MGGRVMGRGVTPAAYIAAVPRPIQWLGSVDPTAGRKAGRGRELAGRAGIVRHRA